MGRDSAGRIIGTTTICRNSLIQNLSGKAKEYSRKISRHRSTICGSVGVRKGGRFMAKKRANGEGNIRKCKDGCWEGRYTAGYAPDTGKRIIKNVPRPRQKSKKNWYQHSRIQRIWTCLAPMITRSVHGSRTGTRSTPNPMCGFPPLSTTAGVLNFT